MRKKTKLFFCGLILLLLDPQGGIAEQSTFKLAAVSLGIGEWIVSTEDKSGEDEIYGVWPQLGLHFKYGSWNFGAQLPLQTSFKESIHKNRWSLGAGELDISKRFKFVTPRVALKYPLYSTSLTQSSVNELFIGSGTVDGVLGMSFEFSVNTLPKEMVFSGDMEGSTVLFKGLADYGSSHGSLTLGANYALGARWKIGVNVQGTYDYWKWIPTFWDAYEESKLAVLPGITLNLRAGRASYFSCKTGFSIMNLHKIIKENPFVGGDAKKQSSLYFGLSLYQGF